MDIGNKNNKPNNKAEVIYWVECDIECDSLTITLFKKFG